tara:strand:+ start:362 stop:610 length:249 start_codon:yes stop_codon:yes gene_type:complete
MYRLHIDIPLGTDEDKAIYKSKLLIQELLGGSSDKEIDHLNEKYNIEQVNYRLGHDEDRQKSNYLKKNENGHVTNKKIRISI